MTINEFLKEERLNRNISIRKFSKLCGVSNSVMTDYENNMYIPSIKTLLKISKALDIDIFTILKETTYLEQISNY